jgi:hypothetical protein
MFAPRILHKFKFFISVLIFVLLSLLNLNFSSNLSMPPAKCNPLTGSKRPYPFAKYNMTTPAKSQFAR